MALYTRIIITLCVLVFAQAVCPGGWIGHGQSCYFLSRDQEPFIGAKTICADHGAYLAEINDATENSFIQQSAVFLNDNNNAGAKREHQKYKFYILGMTDIIQEGVWVLYKSQTSATYINWELGQPDNDGGDENCAQMGPNGTWLDFDCHNPRNYICEKTVVADPAVG